jgi:hypothetical protein
VASHWHASEALARHQRGRKPPSSPSSPVLDALQVASRGKAEAAGKVKEI